MALKPRLQEYAHVTTQLYYRASAAYKGDDRIRTKDGDVPKAAAFTTAWKNAAKEHGLDPKASFIDRTAAQADPAQWGDINLSDAYAQTAGILWPYRHPEKVAAVVAIELGISDVLVHIADEETGKPLYNEDGSPVAGSKRNDKRRHLKIDPQGNVVATGGREVFVEMTNAFRLPKLDANGKLIPTDAVDELGRPLVYERRDDIWFNGYIDLVARDAEGRLGVVDHKSSMGEPPAPFKVERHEQLLVYALMVELIFCEEVAWLGINWLRANRLVAAPYDRAKAEAAMERLCGLVAVIDAKVYPKQHPFSFHTACVRKPKRDNDPPILCSGLKLCHPDIWNFMRKAGAA